MRDHKMLFDINSTSTHHQMMHPGEGADVFLTASLSTFKDVMEDGQIVRLTEYPGDVVDVEGVHYPDFNVLCYQPHPEYDLGNDDHYFATLKRTLEV
jgi:hypothetical protein